MEAQGTYDPSSSAAIPSHHHNKGCVVFKGTYNLGKKYQVPRYIVGYRYREPPSNENVECQGKGVWHILGRDQLKKSLVRRL